MTKSSVITITKSNGNIIMSSTVHVDCDETQVRQLQPVVQNALILTILLPPLDLSIKQSSCSSFYGVSDPFF